PAVAAMRPDPKTIKHAGKEVALKRVRVRALGWFAAAALLLIVGPLLFRRSWRHELGDSGLPNMAYFTALGAGFMLVEVGFIQKLQLYLGHPGFSLGVVLGGLILATGI